MGGVHESRMLTYIDTQGNPGKVDDTYRIEYMKAHIKATKDTVEKDGVDLMGFTMWSPIDLVNASTSEMKKCYGFIYIDKNNDGSGSIS